MKPFLVLFFFLFLFTMAHPYLSRCRSSTWFISKWDARQSQIHTIRGLFTLLASPERKNFVGLVGQRVWFRAFSVKQKKPFWIILQTSRAAWFSLCPRQDRVLTDAAFLLWALGTLFSDSGAFHLGPQNPPGQPALSPGCFRKKTWRHIQSQLLSQKRSNNSQINRCSVSWNPLTDTLFSLGFLIYTRFRTPLTRSKVHQRFEDIYKVPKGIRWIRVRELRFWYPYTCSPSVLEATQNPKQQLYLLRQQSGLMYFRNISSQPHENHTQCLERNTQKWRPHWLVR